ncbi:MAG: hypothetical protein MUF64_29495 [Polyangiaceae bacterium]|jgi:hypothetical protein|nr:hypothetical protein [Polyangiaceae bacterium]
MKKNVLIAMALLAAACSAPPPPSTPAPAASSAPTAAKPATDGQVKLGHFASADGMHGFVLDRTGEKPKLRIDGANEIIELTVKEDRPRGELAGYSMIGPDGTRHLYLSVGGSLRWFKGGKDELPVTKDKDAEPLGEATAKGEYKKPPPAYEAFVNEVKGVAVMSKLKGFKSEDASSLARVGEAFQQAEAPMFFRFSARGETSFLPQLKATPDSVSGIGYGGSEFGTGDELTKKYDKLAALGVRLWGNHQPRHLGNHVLTRSLKDVRLPEGMPGLVWEVNDATAVFVALDGGRYEIPLYNVEKGPTLLKGAGPDASWPAPAQDSYADVSMISAMAKIGAAPQKVVDELVAADDDWNKCAQKGWKEVDRKLDSGKMDMASMKDHARKVEKNCGKSIDKMAATLLAYIEERQAARKALFDKSKARALAVGANK